MPNFLNRRSSAHPPIFGRVKVLLPGDPIMQIGQPVSDRSSKFQVTRTTARDPHLSECNRRQAQVSGSRGRIDNFHDWFLRHTKALS